MFGNIGQEKLSRFFIQGKYIFSSERDLDDDDDDELMKRPLHFNSPLLYEKFPSCFRVVTLRSSLSAGK